MTFKTTKLRDAITFALVAGATAVAGTGVAFAQDADEQPSTQATTLDRIEVTGSRIKRAEIEGALPVTVIDRVQLEASGDVSVADFLRDTTFNSFGSYQSTSGSSGGGASTISLRGLGASRTLVLIDGRRAPTAPMLGQGQDLNSIPMAAVERIEMLSDGASAVYGSDALGGVINIITRRDYDGMEFTMGVGRPTEAGGDTEEYSLIIGASGDRARVLAGASLTSRDVVYTRDRDYWYAGPGESVYSNNMWTSVSTAIGAAVDHPEFGQAVPGLCTNGEELFYDGLVPRTAQGLPPLNRCQFDHSATSADLTSMKNTSVFARGDVQISDDWLGYYSGSAVRTNTFGRYAPVPSSPWPGGMIVLPDGTPNHPGTIGGNNPHAADPYYQSLNGQDIYLTHRFAALGNRDGSVENTTLSFTGGFEGRVGAVDLDFGMRYVQSRALDLGTNYVVGGLAQTAITNGDPTDGGYNIYDPFAGDPNALGMTATISRDMKFAIKEFYASGAFDLFEMAGGTAAMVVGAEYREEQYQDNYDPLQESGQIVGSAGNSAAGSRDVTAVYTELLFPVLDNFEISLAARHDDYSDYGSDTSPKISFRYQPLDTLTLRASYGEGFRAPTLDILSQKSSYSATFTTDPATCLMMAGTTSCEVQVNTYSIANPNLESEVSEQWTVGAVWDATDWLNMSLDYYNIHIENSISSVSLSTVAGCLRGTVDLCPSGISVFPEGTILPNEPLGLGVQFDPATGGIVNAQTGYANIGWVDTQGYDFNLRTNFDMGNWGSLRNNLMLSYVSEYSSNDGASISGRKGYPRIRGSLNNRWTMGDWDFNWNLTYIHGTQSQAYREWRALSISDPTSPDLAFWAGLPDRIPSLTLHDVQVSYNAPWSATISLGVNNVANKAPVYETAYGGTSYDSYLYQPWGRVPYVRYTQRF